MLFKETLTKVILSAVSTCCNTIQLKLQYCCDISRRFLLCEQSTTCLKGALLQERKNEKYLSLALIARTAVCDPVIKQNFCTLFFLQETVKRGSNTEIGNKLRD